MCRARELVEASRLNRRPLVKDVGCRVPTGDEHRRHIPCGVRLSVKVKPHKKAVILI
jgi:hypothetical protein